MATSKHNEMTKKIADWGELTGGYSHHKTTQVGETGLPKSAISIYKAADPKKQVHKLALQMQRLGFKKLKTPDTSSAQQFTINQKGNVGYEIRYTDNGGKNWHKHSFVKPEFASMEK